MMKILKKVLLVVAFMLLSLLLLGFYGHYADSKKAEYGLGSDKEGWKRLSYEGVSISYPPDWEKFKTPVGEAMHSPDKSAFINLMLVPRQGPLIAQTDERTLKLQYEASLSYKEANVQTFEKTEINGAEAITAVIVATEARAPKDTELIYYALIRRGNNAVMLQCLCKEKERQTFEATFKQVVDSITAK